MLTDLLVLAAGLLIVWAVSAVCAVWSERR